MNRKKSFLLAGVAGLAVALGAAVWGVSGSFNEGARAQTETQPAETDASSVAESAYLYGDVVLGSDDAPVTVIEYASLTCGHCGSFHTNSFGEIKADYIDTGKVRWITREIYRFQVGLMATAIARCGGGDAQYYAFLDVFLSTQDQWLAGDVDTITEGLKQIGRLGGLSAERVEACLADEAYHTRLFEDYQGYAAAHSVQSTPTFVIGRSEDFDMVAGGHGGFDLARGQVMRGAQPASALGAVIDGFMPQ